jgi:hypothetical protein
MNKEAMTCVGSQHHRKKKTVRKEYKVYVPWYGIMFLPE